MSGADIGGWVETDFEPVLDAFADELRHARRGRRRRVRVRRRPARWSICGAASPTRPPAGRGRPTRVVLVYSATKGVTSVCANLLIERGRARPARRGREYWPEFGAAGKDAITVAQLMSHQAGLPLRGGRLHARRSARVGPDGAGARRAGADLAARHAARLPHAHVRLDGRRARAPGRRPHDRHVLARRDRGAARPRLLDRFAGGYRAAGRPARAARRTTSVRCCRSSAATCCSPHVFSNPAGLFGYNEMWNTRALHAAELPSSNGIGDARSLARMYALVHRRGRRRAHAAAGDGCRGHRRAGVRQRRGADDRQLLRPRLHARQVVRRREPARPRSATPARAARSRSPIPTPASASAT